MNGLLDYMFDNLEVEDLPRTKVVEHFNYLREIIPQLPSSSQQIKFTNTSIRLNKRLNTLDKLEVQKLNTSLDKLEVQKLNTSVAEILKKAKEKVVKLNQ